MEPGASDRGSPPLLGMRPHGEGPPPDALDVPSKDNPPAKADAIVYSPDPVGAVPTHVVVRRSCAHSTCTGPTCMHLSGAAAAAAPGAAAHPSVFEGTTPELANTVLLQAPAAVHNQHAAPLQAIAPSMAQHVQHADTAVQQLQ